MTQDQIKHMQRRISDAGFQLGEIDGFWGPKSQKACEAYIRSLMPLGKWPRSSQSELQAFYGSPGDESQLVSITFPYPMLYEGKKVASTRVHRKCADSLMQVLRKIGLRYAADSSVMDAAQDYGGIYNNRPMRGGSTPSLHARGAAIDLDADDNGNKVAWPTGADMPLEVIEEFAKEGWTSAAVFWGRDAMHFQATRPD
jgi:hypothetical protein